MHVSRCAGIPVTVAVDWVGSAYGVADDLSDARHVSEVEIHPPVLGRAGCGISAVG